MNPRLRLLLRVLHRLAEARPDSLTIDCRGPTWGEWADILAAAAWTASHIPNGVTVGRVLAILSTVAARMDRDNPITN